MAQSQRIVRETFLFACVLLTGCIGNEIGSGGGSEAPQYAPADTLAVGALIRADRMLIDDAASGLLDYEYVRERSVSVVDEAGKELLRRSHTTRFYGPNSDRQADVQSDNASGTKDAAFWAAFEAGPTVEDTVDWSRRLLEDDPVVLSDQGMAYYRYSVLADTTIGGSDVMRIESSVLPGADRSGIQWARFYIEREERQLVGFELHYVQQSLLFDEDSRFRYMLQKAFDGTWIPSRVDITTFLNLPLSKGQYFDLTATYRPVVQQLEIERGDP